MSKGYQTGLEGLKNQLLLIEILKYLKRNLQTSYECIVSYIGELIGRDIVGFAADGKESKDNKMVLDIIEVLAYLTSLEIITQEVNFERLDKTSVFVQDTDKIHDMLKNLKI
jgi:hypothetical protein